MCALLQAIWLKGNITTYITKKLVLFMTMEKEWKHLDWYVVLFYNLYSHIQDFLAPSKLKETIRKELEFSHA
jgi:hypothetical protein